MTGVWIQWIEYSKASDTPHDSTPRLPLHPFIKFLSPQNLFTVLKFSIRAFCPSTVQLIRSEYVSDCHAASFSLSLSLSLYVLIDWPHSVRFVTLDYLKALTVDLMQLFQSLIPFDARTQKTTNRIFVVRTVWL